MFLKPVWEGKMHGVKVIIEKSYISLDTVLSQRYRYKKKHFATFDFFCKNEACINCETHKRH